MIELKRMILIGGMEKNAGKTTFSEKIINNIKTPLIAVKVTVFRGDREFKKYVIQEETDVTRKKDSSRLLAAGAKQVFWIKTDEKQVEEAIKDLLTKIPTDSGILCESNTLRKFINPALFIMITRETPLSPKPSALAVADQANITIKSSINDETINYSPVLPTQLTFKNQTWSVL